MTEPPARPPSSPRSRLGRAGLLAAALGAGALVGHGLRPAEAKARPSLEVHFGPGQVEAGTAATFLLTLRNAGEADATLGLGDRIDVHHTAGGTSVDLLAAGSALTAAAVPTGFVVQPLAAGTGVVASAQGEVTIPPGGDLLFLLEGIAGGTGSAPVRVEAALSRAAGKLAGPAAFVVAKTAPARELFYGDGALGPLVVSADTELEPLAGYTDVTIGAGVTVTVPSGATIRCTGRFENRGTIVVRPGSPGGGALVDGVGPGLDFAGHVTAPVLPWERGDSIRSPSSPGVATERAVLGAAGGVGLGKGVHSLPLGHWRRGGGGGSGALGAIGGDGGGLLRVLARGEILNAGTIAAVGGTPTANRTGTAPGGGAGGGGGGIVLLASGSSLRSEGAGTIDVRGGAGGPADGLGGGGGGGGGGLVILVAPSIPAVGTLRLDAGPSGLQVLTVAGATWAGGGGGGACAGEGGGGAPVDAAGRAGPASDGMGGFVFPAPAEVGAAVLRETDPRSLWE